MKWAADLPFRQTAKTSTPVKTILGMTCISPIYGYSNFRSGDSTTLVTLLRFVDSRFWIWSPRCTQLSRLSFTPLAQHSAILLVPSSPLHFIIPQPSTQTPSQAQQTTMILPTHSMYDEL